MVSYKSVFKAIFRSEHTDDTVIPPSSSKSRSTPTRAFTVPASPARPRQKTLTKSQPVAGPSTQKHLNPYSNNPNRHSAIALRDILTPRPRLRKNSLPSEFSRGLSVSPPRPSASPIPIQDVPISEVPRQFSTTSTAQEYRTSNDNYLYEPRSSLNIERLDPLSGNSKFCDRPDTSLADSAVRESSNISLLLSPQPEDARKAMSKRLEGLTMALDMFQPISTSPPTRPRHPGFTSRGLVRLDTSLDVTNPLITLPASLKSAAAIGSMSLSPIENWKDEENEDQISDCDEMEGDDDEDLSYFHIPGFKFSGSSHSASSVSSSTSDLPPTPVDLPAHSTDAVQLLPPFLSKSPLAFNLGPVVQSRVDNCKATPTPVVSVDTRDAQSGIVLV